ncbi:hypothetical protein [Oerskovia enterophila]|uniref:hypothetical protein n=1 Tax=Oerskovia enterophila TaxID=43678 RepID=UPI0037F32CD8
MTRASLAQAKRRLEASVVDEAPDGTVAWLEAGEEEWVVGRSSYGDREHGFNGLRGERS